MADKPDSGSRGKALLGVGGKAGLLAGVAGISTVAGLSAAKALRRRRMINDAYEGEDFKLLDADRGCVVTTPDGTSLVVREVGPVTAPLTIVFAHGFCARMGSLPSLSRSRIPLNDVINLLGCSDSSVPVMVV